MNNGQCCEFELVHAKYRHSTRAAPGALLAISACSCPRRIWRANGNSAPLRVHGLRPFHEDLSDDTDASKLGSLSGPDDLRDRRFRAAGCRRNSCRANLPVRWLGAVRFPAIDRSIQYLCCFQTSRFWRSLRRTCLPFRAHSFAGVFDRLDLLVCGPVQMR
jgi:hypothetical protein